MSDKWQTSITTHNENLDPLIRGYNLIDLTEKLNFSQAIFLVLAGKLPEANEEKLLNAILVSSIDHGVEAPSTTIARITASCGVPSSTAIANGVATIGESHGGAAESLAKILQTQLDKTAVEIVNDFKEKKQKLPGFGHKIYQIDPRTQALLKIAKETGHFGKFVKRALDLEKELETSSGKKLPLNIDGVSAALISELGFDYRLGKSFFIISRVVGLAAHVHEEQTNSTTVHRISDDDVDYIGPKSKKLP